MRNFYLDEKDLLKHVHRRLSQATPQNIAKDTTPRKPRQRSLWKLVSGLNLRHVRRKSGISTGNIPICGSSLVKELEQHAR